MPGRRTRPRDEPFRLSGDKPPVLLGNNKGPNAVELLLQALGFCYAVGYVVNAAGSASRERLPPAGRAVALGAVVAQLRRAPNRGPAGAPGPFAFSRHCLDRAYR